MSIPNLSTIVIGASSNPERYSYKAVLKLALHGHTVIPIGIKPGKIEQFDILTAKPILANIHTISLYINPLNQSEWIEYCLQLNPKRLVFNPGTENPDFIKQATEKNIYCLEACTLVMLSLNNYTEM